MPEDPSSRAVRYRQAIQEFNEGCEAATMALEGLAHEIRKGGADAANLEFAFYTIIWSSGL